MPNGVKYVLVLMMLIALWACRHQENTPEVSSGELDAWVKTQGNQIAAQAQQALSSQLKATMSSGGPQQAVRFCNTAALNITDTLSTGFDVNIKRTSLKLRNPQNSPTQIERVLLKEFQQDLGDSITLEPKVIHLDRQLLFAKPILINNPLCLNCHGIKGTQIGEETVQLLEQLYPDDAAHDFTMGDLRGMWSITFNREEVEQFLNHLERN